MNELPSQSPLYHAQHSDRYARQELFRRYEELTNARLVAVVDIIGPWSVTYFEDLVYDACPSEDLHLLLDTPGGDGEVAVRMARSAQARCNELTVIVPNQAKSAGTLIAMGAHQILMGPTSDLGPVDPQLYIEKADQPLVSAKDLIAAVDSALEHVQQQPEAFALLASLLSDVTYLGYQQAQSAIKRTDELIEAALASRPGRSPQDVEDLVEKLRGPFITGPKVHGAMLGAIEAREAGLPVQDPAAKQWEMAWRLWTKYFALIRGRTLIYESRTASQVVTA